MVVRRSRWPLVSPALFLVGSLLCSVPAQSNSYSRSESALFYVNADGSGLRPQIPFLIRIEDPAISPDGKLIAYSSTHPRGGQQIWIRNADGSDPRTIARDKYANSWSPDWSPDGTKIAFVSDRSG